MEAERGAPMRKLYPGFSKQRFFFPVTVCKAGKLEGSFSES